MFGLNAVCKHDQRQTFFVILSSFADLPFLQLDGLDLSTFQESVQFRRRDDKHMASKLLAITATDATIAQETRTLGQADHLEAAS